MSVLSDALHLDQEKIAYCEIDGTLIFLDIGADRYFCLSRVANADMLNVMADAGIETSNQPAIFPRPAIWMPPVRGSDAINLGPFHLADVARALWVQRRVERRLAAESLASVLVDLRHVLQARPAAKPHSNKIAARTIRAFEHARLLRSAANRCLPRSIALVLCLAARGVRAHLVIGVKLAQFGAHSWVQVDDEILNDSVEEVLRHRPILII